MYFSPVVLAALANDHTIDWFSLERYSFEGGRSFVRWLDCINIDGLETTSFETIRDV